VTVAQETRDPELEALIRQVEETLRIDAVGVRKQLDGKKEERNYFSPFVFSVLVSVISRDCRNSIATFFPCAVYGSR